MNRLHLQNIKNQDIFSNIKKQKKAIQILVKILDIRKSLLEKQQKNNS